MILNGAFSAWADVLSGVPQGSVLGPTLFIIFINDIDMAIDITGSFLFKFADDTKVGMVVESESQRDELQSAIANLEQWSQEWQMMFNTSKCHMLHLGRGNKKYQYVMGGQILETVESEKDVGVLVHESLKPSLQCSKASEKANQILGQLSRAVTYRDKQTFLKLYMVYVRPHLEYAVAAWRPWLQSDKQMLEKVQKRAVSMVSNFRARKYEDKLLEAGMITLEQRRERGDLIHMYRIMTGKDDVSHSTWFQTMSDRDGGARTRAVTGYLNVEPPAPSNSEVRRNFFSQRVVATWNSLPDKIKKNETVNAFKNSLDDYKAWGGHPS